jgi:saccharopine dehydrogenase-like NADP-dependent oxidoreductase
MSKILLLGAGLVTRPLVRYLLDKGMRLTIASRTKSKADALLEGHPNGVCRAWTVDDTDGLDRLVAEHDISISLLPAPMHPVVAEACLRHGKHMVTTSYVSPAMKALDERARKQGVVLLNELGVDPGIDHMSAMKIIHGVQKGGGKVVAFRSYCGGIPAPAANDNPWGYKFSWSPLAVLRAASNSARYLKNGKLVDIEAKNLFLDVHHLDIEGIGELESYPNRDSMGYVELYGLQGVSTMFRGTLRYEGWSETLRRVGELGLLDGTERAGLANMGWAELMASLIGARTTSGIKERVAAFLWLPASAPTVQKLEWLGLFSDQKLPQGAGSVIEALSLAMQAKMSYAADEQDMIVMHHDFVADFGSRQERITSSLVDFGVRGGDSSMARTVSLPAAIATRMIAQGSIKRPGVLIPVEPDIYEPILAELATLDIALKERTYPL